jgi:hypothetical protein
VVVLCVIHETKKQETHQVACLSLSFANQSSRRFLLLLLLFYLLLQEYERYVDKDDTTSANSSSSSKETFKTDFLLKAGLVAAAGVVVGMALGRRK